jgi:hypothetical protein
MSLKQNNVRGGRGRKSEASIAVAEARLRIAHVCRGPNVSVHNVRYQPHLSEDGIVAASNGTAWTEVQVRWDGFSAA